MLKAKKYESYKSSNIDFIGDIPKHWEVKKLKFIVDKIMGGGTPLTSKSDYWTENKNDGLLWVAIADITKSEYIENTKKYITEKGLNNSSAQRVEAYSVLYSIYASLGKVAYSQYELTTNQAILAIKPNEELFYKFLFYYLQTVEDKLPFLSSSTTQNNISLDVVKNFDITLPPYTEQEKIANFLDTKNQQIEEFIKAKQKQIALLEEQKEAIINQAVTKGLDETVELKDSAIEWIGDIPKHWEVRKLKFLADIYNGSTPKSTVKEFWDGYITWITPQDISSIEDDYIYSSSRTITKDGYDNCGTYLVPENSIILTTRAPIGNIAIATKKLCTNQGCKSIVVNNSNEYKYIYYLLITFKDMLQSLGTGTTFLELSTTNLISFYMPTPSKSEQKQIIKYIEIEQSKIDKTITQIQKEIDLIKEYKVSLINEVVTGQIKVV